MIHEERDRIGDAAAAAAAELLVSLPEMLPRFRDTETGAVRRDIILCASGRAMGAR